MKIGIISLGCDKNRVDTENIITSCVQRGYVFSAEADEAEILLVNTCAFLESAREESIDAILEAAAYKQQNCRMLIVAGCLPMRYLDQLKQELPEVDLWLLPQDYHRAGEILDQRLGETHQCRSVSSRRLTTPEHYAYIKIADGCDNFCTYCMIPSIRGRYCSRPPQEILEETAALARDGVKEVILVAQDTTRYGKDHPEYGTLASLVNQISEIAEIEKIRLLYCYPECITDELIETIAHNDKVVKYLDIPLQHISDSVLKRMNRRSTRASVEALISKLRAKIADLTIRTTMMIGFPGETQQDVDELCDFLSTAQLNHVGFFTYSKETETPSAKLDGHLSEDVKQQRLALAASVQQAIVFRRAERMIGQTVRVCYEGIDYDRNMFVGRPDFSAPDIDPVVYFTADFVNIGETVTVKIVGVDDYDFVGQMIPGDTKE